MIGGFEMSTIYGASTFLAMIQDGYKYTTHYQKNVRETNTEVEEYEEKLTDMRKAIKNLNQYKSATTTKEKLEKQLKNFVKTYNEVKDGAEEITDKKMLKSLKQVESLLTEHEKELKKLGIRENTKGEIIFDSEKFEDVEQKDIDKLLVGKDSLIRDIFKMTKTLQKQAKEARYNTVNRQFFSQIPFESDNVAVATASLELTVDISKCEAVNTLIQNGSMTDEQITNIHDNINCFINSYNTLSVAYSENSQITAMVEKTASYQNELSTIGISIDESSNILTYSKVDTLGTDEYKAAYEILFGNSDSTYSNLLEQYATKIYTTALDTDSHGISIDMQL